MSRTAGHCAVCGGPVLGLRGHDVFLDLYFLRPEDEAAGLPALSGDLHLECLRASPAMPLWRQRIRENLAETRRLRSRRLADGTELFLLPATREVVVLSDALFYTWLDAATLKGFRRTDDMLARRLRARVALEGDVGARLAALLDAEPASRWTLRAFLTAIGVTDLSGYRPILDAATVRAVPPGAKAAARVEVAYPLHIPHPVFAAVLDLLSARPSAAGS